MTATAEKFRESLSSVQRTLLNYAKDDCLRGAGTDWRSIAKVLQPIYGYNLTLTDVVRVTLNAYEQTVIEPRFELATGQTALQDLVLSPIVGIHSVFPAHEMSCSSRLTIEEFYDAMLASIIAKFCIARVDWLRAA